MGRKATGDLLVKGPWIVKKYFNNEDGDPLVDGWFPTGDVATIDADGYLQITDRSKDVIKSGGEWISSIDIENIAVAHPAVAMAACIGVRHPKWDERPIVVVARKPGAEVTREELLAFYEARPPGGRSRTMWCSSSRSRWGRPARSSRRAFGSSSGTTSCRLARRPENWTGLRSASSRE